MEEIKVQLPVEINDLALKVPENKQLEVRTVLDSIFAGTEAWEKQVDEIKVKDINDTMSIGLADAARKNAKTARLNAEKIFDEKRAEVQLRMQDDKLEDVLWLKSKQITQLKLKHIEEKAKFKADFVKRYEAEQLQLKTELRHQQVLKFIPDEEISSIELSQMSDTVYDAYLSGIEKAYTDKVEFEKQAELERKEKERLGKLHNERKDSILELWKFVDDFHKDADFSDLCEGDWIAFVAELLKEREEEDTKIKAQKEENERLKVEAKEKARLTKIEAERIEKEREDERKKQAEILEKQRKEAEEKAEIEAKKKAKIERLLKVKESAEKEAKKFEEELLQAELNKGDAEKVTDLINDLKVLKVKYQFKSAKNVNKYIGVGELIDKVIGYIKN